MINIWERMTPATPPETNRPQLTARTLARYKSWVTDQASWSFTRGSSDPVVWERVTKSSFSWPTASRRWCLQRPSVEKVNPCFWKCSSWTLGSLEGQLASSVWSDRRRIKRWFFVHSLNLELGAHAQSSDLLTSNPGRINNLTFSVLRSFENGVGTLSRKLSWK